MERHSPMNADMLQIDCDRGATTLHLIGTPVVTYAMSAPPWIPRRPGLF